MFLWRHSNLLLALSLVFASAAPLAPREPQPPAVTVTITGVVAGPGGPVSGVQVGVGSSFGYQATNTGSNGAYTLTVQVETNGNVWFNVRPPFNLGLAQANLSVHNITGNFTQNFTLEEGYGLSVRLTGQGITLTYPVWLQVQPLYRPVPSEASYQLDWDGALQRWQAMLPRDDVYYVTVSNVPAGYYETTQAFNLNADVFADLPLNTRFVHPIPDDPPDASQINIGPVDLLGEAVVTGAAGAALPYAHVLLINLNTQIMTHTLSSGDGSFSAKLFAPPGSAIMIKHGPPSWRWNDIELGIEEGLNPYPGTIVHVASSAPISGNPQIPFAATGAIEYLVSGVITRTVYSAWALTGTIGPVVAPGEWARVISGTYAGANVPGLYLGGLNWTHPALNDLDEDGDLDLVVGQEYGTLMLFRNAGNATTPAWQFESENFAGVDTNNWAYPLLVDLTNDGAPDLFVGQGNGGVAIYHNTGVPGAPDWPATPDATLTTPGSNASPALDDLDGDGDLDLLVGKNDGTVSHFANTGTLTSPVWSLLTHTYGGLNENGNFANLAFIDLDGDGDRDLLTGICGSLLWYERSAAINPTWTRQASDPIGYGGGSCAVSPGVGDWDNDGTLDVVTGEHWGVLRYFASVTVTTWSEVTFNLPFDFLGDSAPALADWDNDGDLDLLVGQAHGNVHQFTNVGSTSTPNWQDDGVLLTIPWTNHPHAFPALADIDGDNDEDLVVGEGGWQGAGAGGNLHYYENQGAPLAPNWVFSTSTWLGVDVGGWSTPAFADIDADSDLDLFVGAEDGTLAFIQNTGTLASPVWAAPVQPYASLQVSGYAAPAFLDVDEDNDLDLLMGNDQRLLMFAENTGTASSPTWDSPTIYASLDTDKASVPTTGDLNGDAQNDLLVGGRAGGLRFFTYQGPGAPPPSNVYAPGDFFQIAGALRLYSQGIDSGTNVGAISVNGSVSVMMLYDENGQPVPAKNNFVSNRLTPGGLPILHQERPIVYNVGALNVASLQYAGGNLIEGQLTASGQIPDDLPPGIYRAVLNLGFSGVPQGNDWRGAVVVFNTLYPNEAALPPIQITTAPLSGPWPLAWELLMTDGVQGARGVIAREDRGRYHSSTYIVSQGAPFIIPPVDMRASQPITYRLEPFLPMISFTDRRMPNAPLIPFDLPGGQLCVNITEPDGGQASLGCEAFAQSFNRTPTTRGGQDLNSGTVQVEDIYSLKAATNRFRAAFDQFGRYVITMTGTLSDTWGNSYSGGGTYDVWVAYPLDIDPGVLPGTPLAVGQGFNPALQLYPHVPAAVTLTVTLYPNSDPAQAITRTLTGAANEFGYFSWAGAPITMPQPGEYQALVVAQYTEPGTGEMWMGTMTWGGIVMTPDGQADLRAHGRRGLDNLAAIPGQQWFINCSTLTPPPPPGSTAHMFAPYFNGDVMWSRLEPDQSCDGFALKMAASVQDTVGVIETALQTRYNRMSSNLQGPGDFAARAVADELPLFSSTNSGYAPQMLPSDVDQIAYAYLSAQRPGVRVRESVVEDGQSSGYWRLATTYDDQFGVGVQGDLANDFKFQYIGVVYRDLTAGHNEYVGQGTGWIRLSQTDVLGRDSRVMPPFAGPGNGGWPTDGGPLVRLFGQDVHQFILPTGVQPGAVLAVGDRFHFAGHFMPTSDSKVLVTVTAPSGAQFSAGGQANKIGYFYDPNDDFTVNEAGLWSVDVRTWHDGLTSGGMVNCDPADPFNPALPCPSGNVLGSASGRYWFYVVPNPSTPLTLLAPQPGYLTFPNNNVAPVVITGVVPTGLTGVTVDYTIRMPGYILKHEVLTPTTGTFSFVFDPAALAQDFPNLDLSNRYNGQAGLSDTFSIGILLRGQGSSGAVYRAATLVIQDEEVFVASEMLTRLYLPTVRR